MGRRDQLLRTVGEPPRDVAVFASPEIEGNLGICPTIGGLWKDFAEFVSTQWAVGFLDDGQVPCRRIEIERVPDDRLDSPR